MKKLLVVCTAVLGISMAAMGQTKAQLTAKISTPTVQCDMCKERIESYLKKYDGLTYVNVNVRRKEITVKYLTDRTNIENIKTAIANAGYGADDIAANPESYKALPKCCRKPAGSDGKKH